jgi:hypothetical protein
VRFPRISLQRRGRYDGPTGLGTSDGVPVELTTTAAKVSPHEGPAAGSTKVTITGTNFTGAKEVKSGSVAAKRFTVATAITAESGTVDVTATTAASTSATSSADDFSYVEPPPVTTAEPSTGPG